MSSREQKTYDKTLEKEVGTCYVCGFECNPSSQCCGICARNMTMSALGWDVYHRTPKEKQDEKNK